MHNFIKKKFFHIAWVILFTTYFVWGIFYYFNLSGGSFTVYPNNPNYNNVVSFITIHQLLCMCSMFLWFWFFGTIDD